MALVVTLNSQEISLLDAQDPSTRSHGGFQSLMVNLQNKLDRSTNELALDDNDLRRIQRYAYCYQSGGWQDRLMAIFGRTLGPSLGRSSSP